MGGMFGQETISRKNSVSVPASFLNEATYCYFNGRSAFYSLLKYLAPRRVWLPAYLCHTIVDAVIASRIPFQFYPVSRSLKVLDDGWVDTLTKGDLVYLIDFFGFKTPEEFSTAIRKNGCWLLEDAAHAPFNLSTSSVADFVIVSPRKLMGVAYGALLIDRTGLLIMPAKNMNSESACIVSADRAFRARTAYDHDGEEKDWYAAYLQSAERQPITDEQVDKRCLRNYFSADSDYIAERRRTNFQFLLGHFAHLSLFKTLPDNTIPLGFPVLLEHRDQVQNNLFKSQIYCPIHWHLGNWLPPKYEDSHYLQDHILTLLCDQRIDHGGIVRLATEFAKALR